MLVAAPTREPFHAGLPREVLLSGNHKYENRFRAHVDHKKPAGSYWYLVGFREPFGTRAARMETSSVSIIVDFEDATLTDGFGGVLSPAIETYEVEEAGVSHLIDLSLETTLYSEWQWDLHLCCESSAE